MKKLSTHIRKHLPAYLIAVFGLVVSVGLDMLSPQLTKQIIDDVIGHGNIGALGAILLGIFAIGIGRLIFGYIKEYTFDVTGARIASGRIFSTTYRGFPPSFLTATAPAS